LIEVAFSPDQFAQLITHMNCGPGVPCTVKWVNGEAPDDPPELDKKAQFRNEFDRDAKRVARLLDEAVETAESILKGQRVTKGDVQNVLNAVRSARAGVGGNMPFLAESFEGQMEKSVTEATAAVESFVTRTLVETGLKALSGGAGPFPGPAAIEGPAGDAAAD
jgi:hypothetical protein